MGAIAYPPGLCLGSCVSLPQRPPQQIGSPKPFPGLQEEQRKAELQEAQHIAEDMGQILEVKAS